MNPYLSATTDTLASAYIPHYGWGKTLTNAVSSKTPHTVIQKKVQSMAYGATVVPLVEKVVFCLPYLQSTISMIGKCIAEGTKTMTSWWISRLTRNAIRTELNTTTLPIETDAKLSEIENHLHQQIISALNPIIAKSNLEKTGEAASKIATKTIKKCVLSKSSHLLAGRFLNMSSPSMKITAFSSVLGNTVTTVRSKNQAMSREEKNKIKSLLVRQIKKDAIQKITSNLKPYLERVLEKVATTIIEHPTTDLLALRKELDQNNSLKQKQDQVHCLNVLYDLSKIIFSL